MMSKNQAAAATGRISRITATMRLISPLKYKGMLLRIDPTQQPSDGSVTSPRARELKAIEHVEKFHKQEAIQNYNTSDTQIKRRVSSDDLLHIKLFVTGQIHDMPAGGVPILRF